MNIKVFLKEKKLLLLVGVAFLVRVIGISHSLPFIYNVDEPTVVRSTIMLRESFNPGHFDWPHFYYYINGLFYIAFVFLRNIVEFVGLKNSFLVLWNDPTIFYLISRVVTSIFASLTLIPAYYSIKLFSSKKLALYATLIFSLIPFHVFISEFAVLEPAMLFFISIATYYILKINFYNNLKDYLYAGVFIGLATSIKYNAIFVLVPLLIANILYLYNKKEFKLKIFLDLSNLKKLTLAFTIAITTLLLTSPFIIFDFQTFIRSDSPVGFFWQAKNLGRVNLELYPYLVLKNLFFTLPKTISFSLWGIFIYKFFNFVYLKRRKATEYISLGFIVVYLLYVSQFERQADHYFVPLYLFIVIFCLDIIEKVLKNKKLLSLFIVLMLVQVTYYKILILNVDSRTKATNYIESSLSNDNVVMLRFGEYFPIIDNKNVKVKDVDEFFYEDLASSDYPNYILWSKYAEWPEDIGSSDWQKLDERTKQDGVVAKYSGFLNLGPNIVIYKPNW